MSKISTYPGPSLPSLSDKLIGTDVNDMLMTKNFTISDIISVAGSSTYVPYTGGNNDVFLPGYGFYANEFVVYGGTSSQFLKADGSIDSNVYALASSITGLVPYTGATGDVDLGANKLTADAILARSSTGILYLSPSPFDTVGLKLEFLTGVYSLGDYTSLSGGTYIIVDDANTRIELSKGIYTNGSEGSSGQVLTSQGAGLPATWSTPFVVPTLGSFYDTTVQGTAGTVFEIMQFNSTDISTGVSIVNDGLGDPTKITFSASGVYNIQFSAQLKKTGGAGATLFYIYLIKDGTPVSNSATAVTLENNGDLLVAAWNWFITIPSIPSYCQIGWYTNNANGELHYDAAPVVGIPAIPSVILTVNRVS
jgi:hypothetical protein